MASTYSNLFDLLGGDETDDNVSDLYERLKKKADEEVPSSPPKTRRQYIVFDENSENVDSKEEAHVNGNENGTKSDEEGWKVVSKRAYGKKFQEYGNENANGDGSEQIKENGDVNGNGNGRGGKKRGRGKRGKGSVRYGNGDNGEVQDSSNVGNGDGVESVVADNPTVNSEVDAVVTVEALNGEETKETEITEEVKADVPKPEETAEQRKERLRLEQIEKEKEEWEEEKKRLRRLEAEEEAKKMTLDQYEKILLEKKQALNLEKAKPTRVVSADEDFDNMKLVGKKLDNDEILIVEKEKPKGKAALVKSTSESTLEKSESFDKEIKSEESESFDKGTKSLAVDLAELFKPKPFRPPFFRGGRSWGERNHENQGGVVHRLPSQNGSTRNKLPRKNRPPNERVLKDQIQFPVLGFVPPVLPPESSAPPANPTTPSEPNSSESAAPPANPSTLSEPNSSESSAPPADPSTLSEPNSAESSAPPANPSTSSGPNRAEPSIISHRYQNRKRRQKNKGNRSTTSGAKTAAANSSVTTER